jgi:DNA-binding NtrC family response regulator
MQRNPGGEQAGLRKGLRSLMDDYERKLILLALDAAGGHQRRAAASLGILASTLSEKMKRLGLRSPARAWSPPDPELVQARDGILTQ